MKKAFLLLLLIAIFYSCKKSETQTTEVKDEVEKHFDDIENDIKKYKTDAQKYWDKMIKKMLLNIIIQ